jgi:outer membrane protein TolC
MGLEPDAQLDIATDPDPIAVPEESEGARRAALIAVEKKVAQSDAEVAQANAGYWPNFEAFSSVFYNYGAVNDRDTFSYAVGIGMAWRAWDGLGTRSRVREAEARAAQSRAHLLKLERAVSLEQAAARIHYLDADERLRVTAHEIELASEHVALVRARFEEGLALAAELLDAETQLSTARIRRTESEADRLAALAAYRKALGLAIIDHGDRS